MRHNARVFFAWSILLWVTASCAFGQIEGIVTTKNVGGRGVLRISYVHDRSPTSGFGAMHVRVTSVGGPSRSDRNLTLAMQINYGSDRSMQSVCFFQPVLLAEGATSATVEIPHFLLGSYHAYGLMRVIEDRRDIRDESSKFDASISNARTRRQTSFFNLQSSTNQVLSNAFALIESGQSLATSDQRLEQLLQLKSQNSPAIALSQSQMIYWTPLAASNEMHKRARYVAQASDDWRYYYISEKLLVPLDALQEAIDGHPKVAAALKTFVASGGMLIVHADSIPDVQSLVDRWLDGPVADKPETSPWLRHTSHENTANTEHPPESEEIISHVRQFLLGRIVAADSLPVTENLAPSNMYTAHVGDSGSMLNFTTDGNWYWRNLIQSQGKPPVWTFCAFVGLFGCVIGPGLLYFTGRMQRRSLMIFFVPVLSTLATLVIIGYAVLYEGFDTSIRISGVVALDETGGKGFAWSRQNYFSGLPPAEGLQFRSTTFVRPVIDESDANRRYSFGHPESLLSTRVDLGQDKQVWRNWLRARQQQQMLVGHQVEAGIPISVAWQQPTGVTIKNLTDQDLPFVIVRGPLETYYVAEYLPARSGKVCLPVDWASAASMAARARSKIRPSAPEELLASSSSLWSFNRSMGRSATIYANENSIDIINAAYDQLLSDRLRIPPSSFVTVMNSFEQVEVPLEGKIVESRFLVVGTVKW